MVVLATDLTDELLREGIARDVVRFIQDGRKQKGCDYTDRISVQIATASAELRQSIQENLSYIQGETLAHELQIVSSGEGETMQMWMDPERLHFFDVDSGERIVSEGEGEGSGSSRSSGDGGSGSSSSGDGGSAPQ